MASDTKGVWEIRTEKVERMFRELDLWMLGCRIPPEAGIEAAVRARRRIALGAKKASGHAGDDQPARLAHERGGEPRD